MLRRLLVIGLSGITLALVSAAAFVPGERAFADPNAALVITSTLPADAVAGQGTFLMKVYGDGFPADVGESSLVSITWNGVAIPATVKSSTEVHVNIPENLLSAHGQVQLGVQLSSGANAQKAGSFRIWRNSSDTNCDGVVSSFDALHVMRVIAEIDQESGDCSIDANRDGAHNVSDANWVRQDVARLVQPLKSTPN